MLKWSMKLLLCCCFSFCFAERLDEAIVSIYAVDLKTKKVLISDNSSLNMMPASCLKVVTTGAALHILGPKQRFETHLEYDGFIKDSTLHGNLYIKGGGDPCLGSSRIKGSLDLSAQVDQWSDAILKLGIKKIKGNIIGDASKWERALAPSNWMWEDLGNYYGAGACALSFHENLYNLVFIPGSKVSDKVTLTHTIPHIPKLAIFNELTTGEAQSGDCTIIYGSEYSAVQAVRGTVPIGVSEFTIKGSIPDPAAFCAFSLEEALIKKGVRPQHKVIGKEALRKSFHVSYSPTVQEIVYWTNQKSLNLYAEHLLKQMGKEGTTDSGVKSVMAFWKSQGIDLKGIADGSGLSRKNLVSTKALVDVLRLMKESEHFDIFKESLVEDGEHYIKTGAMSQTRGCVGYKGDIAFAILINHSLDSQAMKDRIAQFLEELP